MGWHLALLRQARSARTAREGAGFNKGGRET